MFKSLYDSLKYAYQRVTRGYDDRIYWGFQGWLEETFLPPLEDFCDNQLEDKELMRLNPKRKKVFITTIKLIDEMYDAYGDFRRIDEIHKVEKALWSYIGKNIDYYWD